MQILALDKNCLLPKDYICGLCESSFKWVLYTLSPCSSCGIIMDFPILFFINFLKNKNKNKIIYSFSHSERHLNLLEQVILDTMTVSNIQF